jgi:uncharacterized phage-associated protein
MPIDANVVANEFLSLGQRDVVSIEPMKLQKLLYLAHGWHLVFFSEGLISQGIEAWKYGPVIPEVYREFKEFKGSPITRRARISDAYLGLSAIQKPLIESVWRIYKDKTGIYLSMLTHERGSAWERTRHDCTDDYSAVIPNDRIREEFQRRKRDSEAKP